MALPHPHINIDARSLFRRLYHNNGINLELSKKSLADQLNFYLDHLSTHINRTISKRDRERIESIIERNNQVARILESPQFRTIAKKNRQLLGKVILGLVFCIDGRIPTIFLGGRFAKHFEVPAAEITTFKRKSDNKLIPDSTDLNEAIRKAATLEEDLLEVVFAHTSLLDSHHGCGAMAAKRKNGQIDTEMALEDANLKIIEQKSIPALTNIYNEFRTQQGLEPLKMVGISALYDTDTFGIILNYNQREKASMLSTTELTNKYREQMEDRFVSSNLMFGAFQEKFSFLKYLNTFSQNVLKVTEAILSLEIFSELKNEVEQYIDQNYPDLTPDQKQALRFLLIRNISFQYLTGLSSVKKRDLTHPFAQHKETYMAVAMRGATIGKFDPETQGFASTPSDPQSAINNINTMLSIMGDSHKIKPYVLFVCNSLNERDVKDNNEVMQRIMGSNAGLLRDIVANPKLGAMIENGEIIPVPVLIAEDTREVLKIVDHSAYI